MPQLCPLYLKLEGKIVLIVGGGEVALQKWRTLRETGAAVTVVAPAFHPELARAAAPGRPRLVRRAFRPSDLEGVRLVFAATDDPALNHRVCEAAGRAGILANAVDDPAHCDFYTPAVFRRGALALAISTSGNFPGLSRALREALEAWLPEADEHLLNELLALRGAVRNGGATSATRAEALRGLLERFKEDYLNPAGFLPAGEAPTETSPMERSSKA
jgi:siroheme synthase-like protein